MTNERPTMKKFFQWCLVALGLYLLFPLYLFVTGFPVWQPGWYVGEKLVERGKSISECMKIISTPSLFGGPMAGEHRQMCVTRYANLNPDPQECKKINNANLKMECLGIVENKLLSKSGLRLCSVYYGSTELQCLDEQGKTVFQVQNPQLSNCDSYKYADAKDWCLANSTRVSGTNHCDKIQNQAFADQCLLGLAYKKQDASLCKAAFYEKDLKELCEIQLDVWKQNPNLRNAEFYGETTK